MFIQENHQLFPCNLFKVKIENLNQVNLLRVILKRRIIWQKAKMHKKKGNIKKV
jgi:hypothetical protein